ncbi:hypothetical protein Q9G87_59045 [Nonomuraea sp. G32]|nr:hypothetical protein [Nonomuraea sp. G32]
MDKRLSGVLKAAWRGPVVAPQCRCPVLGARRPVLGARCSAHGARRPALGAPRPVPGAG